jgi:hypothetical protein
MAKSNLPVPIPQARPPAVRNDQLPAIPAALQQPVQPANDAVPKETAKPAPEPHAKIGAGMLESWLRLGGQELGNLFTHQLPFAGNDPGHPFNATPQQVYEARQPQEPDHSTVNQADTAGAAESRASSLDARLKSFITGKDRGVHGPELEKSADREGPERE